MNKRRIRPLEGNSYSGFESGDEHKDNSMTDLDQTTRTEMEAATFRRLLQHLDLPRQGRLGQVQPRRGPAEMHLLGDGDEAAGVAEIEH